MTYRTRPAGPRRISAEPRGDILPVGQSVGEFDDDASAGDLGALAEGGDHASFDPSRGGVTVALLEGSLGEDDVRERCLEDLDDLSAAAHVGAHSLLVADAEFLPPLGAYQVQQVRVVTAGMV